MTGSIVPNLVNWITQQNKINLNKNVQQMLHGYMYRTQHVQSLTICNHMYHNVFMILRMQEEEEKIFHWNIVIGVQWYFFWNLNFFFLNLVFLYLFVCEPYTLLVLTNMNFYFCCLFFIIESELFNPEIRILLDHEFDRLRFQLYYINFIHSLCCFFFSINFFNANSENKYKIFQLPPPPTGMIKFNYFYYQSKKEQQQCTRLIEIESKFKP